ncbi:hypothetical protein HPB48_003552 [Haemaphysalis longicornis]|uniref:Uncharacterized protein n=1 Tax=Haemaphysalis longicornis TaxID=44386 RepID=A0A9J6FBM5_HAELO|nr:hypothetical protein HPB48_003552 [Haemaphysalis longicornis]
MDILDVLGGFGVYHVLIVILVVLRAFPTAWTNMMTPIVAPDMDHWCARPENASSEIAKMSAEEWKSWAVPEATAGRGFARCQVYRVFQAVNGSWVVDRNETLVCDRWEYDTSVYENTIVNEWDLVCGRGYHRSVVQSVVMAGALVGVLLFGEMSDRDGGDASPLPDADECGLRDRLHHSAAATASAGLPRPRLALPATGNGTLRSHDGAVLVVSTLVAKESPRWLLTKGRIDRAEKSLVRILKINRRPAPDMDQVMSDLAIFSKSHELSRGFSEERL